MSFILDALRKSEHERQRQAGPSLAELPVARPRSRFPLAYGILGVLLVLNLAALAVFMLRDQPHPAPAADSGTSADAARASTPPVTRPAPPPAAIPAPVVAPPAAVAQTQAPVRPLTAEADPQFDQPAPSHLEAPDAPDPTLLPEPPRNGAAAKPGRSHVTTEGVPTIDDLPPSATAGLPTLNLDLHVYGPDATKRFVFLNNRRYVEGSSTPEGIKIERITPEGVVLGYRGTHFLLTRP